MDPRKYAEAILEFQIAALEAEIAALKPRGWEIPPLALSYLEGQSLEAVIDVWDGEYAKLHAARHRALADHHYGERKLQHLYL